ncbi:hypothetical protein [uncultured Bacteroides sp.]|uniref:hypothetical protein n=1 Tax=uncultured Bacteroides sp. TaxID=162156 RepID=UPI00280BA45A|nr:hypothetical protein [uncultured Bacteroides sp.]
MTVSFCLFFVWTPAFYRNFPMGFISCSGDFSFLSSGTAIAGAAFRRSMRRMSDTRVSDMPGPGCHTAPHPGVGMYDIRVSCILPSLVRQRAAA